MRIDITGGVTASPYIYTYTDGLGDDPNFWIEAKNSDNSYTFDATVEVKRSADGTIFTITGEADSSGKFLNDYRFLLYANYETLQTVRNRDSTLATGSNDRSFTNAALQLREANRGVGTGYSPPAISFHWGGVVASQISIETNGRIAIMNNPGTGYESLVAQNLYAAGLIQGDRIVAGYDSGFGGSVNASNWFRSSGVSGWYNATFEGGIYMSDTSWIRSLSNKGFYTEGGLHIGGQAYIGGGADIPYLTVSQRISLPSSTGDNYFTPGTGDGASYQTYNLTLSCWWGMAFKDPYGSVNGVLDFRTGSLTMNGAANFSSVVARSNLQIPATNGSLFNLYVEV